MHEFSVNVSPGAIYTPIQAETCDAKQMKGWGQDAGLGRPGEPSEIATSFVFLVSADASLYCKFWALTKDTNLTWELNLQFYHDRRPSDALLPTRRLN